MGKFKQILFAGRDSDKIPEFSSLSLHDSDDEAGGARQSNSPQFMTPQKPSRPAPKEEDLEAAIESGDFSALEGLGLKLALLARMGDLSGIKRITGQGDSARNSYGSYKSRDNSFQGPPTSSSSLSTPDTVVAVPTSPISPRLGSLNYFTRGSCGDRVCYSPYITSVKSTGNGLSSERVSPDFCRVSVIC